MPNLHGNFSAKTAVETVLNVPDNTWTALPTTAMGDRNLVEVFNKGENRLYFSFDSTTIIKFRSAIGTGEFKMFPIQDNLTLFARSQGGSNRVIVTEYK
ncbi:hypothetical protein LCGC14_0540470 [marine sediment metagenome]|uniref:Uncharacterized protein n=1 Tax=marine sediment metagenome TaxID=412755 RepID=A0A0F9RXL8_9ZZZZ